MNETHTGNRSNGWKWVAIALLALFALMATCAFSALWGGLFGYAIGKSSVHRTMMPEYSYEEPWVYPFETEPEMPYDPDSRAWLGVGFVTREDGAEVTTVTGGSPADSAGIQVEDVITEVNGEPVTSNYPLDEHILGYSPGDRVEITLLRNGRAHVVSVRLGSRSDSGMEWYEEDFPFEEPLIPDLEG